MTESSLGDDVERVGALKHEDNHASWRDVYRACNVTEWRP